MNGLLKQGLNKLRETGSNLELRECLAKRTDREKMQYLRRMGYLSFENRASSHRDQTQKTWGKVTRQLKGVHK